MGLADNGGQLTVWRLCEGNGTVNELFGEAGACGKEGPGGLRGGWREGQPGCYALWWG